MLRRACSDEDDDRVLRGLFEGFEERVRPFFVEIIGVVKDRDASSAEESRASQFRAETGLHTRFAFSDQEFDRDEGSFRRFADVDEVGVRRHDDFGCGDVEVELFARVAFSAGLESREQLFVRRGLDRLAVA